MKISLILPHQLFYPNPVLSRSRTVFILADPIFLNDKEYPTRFHKQKIMLHLLSIKSYSDELNEYGYNVKILDNSAIKSPNDYESFFKTNKVKKRS